MISNDKVPTLSGICITTLLEKMSSSDLNKMNGLINKVRKKRKTDLIEDSFREICPSWLSLRSLVVKTHGKTGRLQYIQWYDYRGKGVKSPHPTIRWNDPVLKWEERKNKTDYWDDPDNTFMNFNSYNGDTKEQAIKRAKKFSQKMLTDEQLSQLYDFCQANKFIL